MKANLLLASAFSTRFWTSSGSFDLCRCLWCPEDRWYPELEEVPESEGWCPTSNFASGILRIDSKYPNSGCVFLLSIGFHVIVLWSSVNEFVELWSSKRRGKLNSILPSGLNSLGLLCHFWKSTTLKDY